MITYARYITVLNETYDKNKIDITLERLMLPTLRDYSSVKKHDKYTKRLKSWYSGSADDPELDKAFYRILAELDVRIVINTLLIAYRDTERVFRKLKEASLFDFTHEELLIYSKCFWDVSEIDRQAISNFESFNTRESNNYITAVYKPVWQAELAAGIVPDVDTKSLLKLIAASGMKTVSEVLNGTTNITNPERLISMSIKAMELLRDIDTASLGDPASELKFKIAAVEKSTDICIDDLDGEIIDTNALDDES